MSPRSGLAAHASAFEAEEVGLAHDFAALDGGEHSQGGWKALGMVRHLEVGLAFARLDCLIDETSEKLGLAPECASPIKNQSAFLGDTLSPHAP